MKSKSILTVVVSFLCLGLFFGIFVDTVAAQAGGDHYKVSIAEKHYEIYKIGEINGQTIIYYNIYITLNNSGTVASDNITLEIVGDDGLPLFVTGSIAPGGSREFKWENGDFFLVGAQDHYINISYYPTLPTVTMNENNSGEDFLILKYNPVSGTDNTPGFEAVFLFLLLALYVTLRKYK